jgi:hypothetical protein
MKSLRNRILAIAAVGLAAVCANSSPAPAQSSSAGGRFTLPYEVNWKDVVLPAGDYTFSLKTLMSPAIVQVRGPNDGAFIMATAMDEKKTDQQSSLTIESRGSTRFVREMYLADFGLHIHYAMPKIPKNEKELAQGPVTTEHVLVSMGGK